MRPPLFILLIAIPSLFVFGKRIPWSQSRKLTNHDYKAVDPHKSKSAYGALTHHKISISYTISAGSIEYEVTEYFVPDSSWMKLYTGPKITPQEKDINHYQATRGLSHEQGHFDLGEIYARRLSAALTHYGRKSNEDQLADTINTLLKEMARVENTYDRETLHSQDSLAQDHWNHKIAQMLDSLSGFRNVRGVVGVK